MLRLGSCIAARLLSAPSAPPISPLDRLLSAATFAVSPNPTFTVEKYLVATCGLSSAQALKASRKLSRLKSPTNLDNVLTFLAGFGLSGADVAALVGKDPMFLCASVDRMLAHNIVMLTDLGLSHTEIARFVSLARHSFRRRKFIASSLPYYLMTIFGSSENFLRALKLNNNLLTYNLERFVKPNVAILRECGRRDCVIAKLSIDKPRMLTNNPERVQESVACAEGICVPRDFRMLRIALTWR